MPSRIAPPTLRGGPVQPSTGALQALGPDEVSLTGGFWREKQELNSEVILGHCERWMERIGWIGNFDRAALGTLGTDHSGIEFVDSEVYKLLEALAWELGRKPDDALESRYRTLVARVEAAQEPDGYLHTSFGRAGQPRRYSNLEWGHELYCFGHLIQAAVARLRSGCDDELVQVARRLADHVYTEFGPDGRDAVCGHPEIEVALVEFSRATGDARYLELAGIFVERRGRGLLKADRFGAEYFLDDLPVRDATVLRGHAVRALYLASGALDVAVETGDVALAGAVATQWENTVARRTYITGGVGSHHLDEAFGEDYELPPDRAYAETCAGIASVMLSWRLLLQTGDAQYADLIERTLLNNILASPREDGRAFYYTNTLHQRVDGTVPEEDEISVRAQSSLRAPWFEVSCCPTNIARTLASVNLYFATKTGTGVQLHQYGDYDVSTRIETGSISLGVRTGYPFDGAVSVLIREAPDAAASVSFRIPAWAVGRAVVHVNGIPVPGSGATITVSRVFRAGDEMTLHLPMTPRLTRPHPSIDAVRGTVAVERGPLVMCLESTDLPDGRALAGILLDDGADLTETARGVRAHLVSTGIPKPDWPYSDGAWAGTGNVGYDVELIPYCAWANRGPSTMRVWLPVALPGRGTARA
ncbi:glycoside hydrolase family 127 protein [Cryobacterium algoricola]|uniref:Glycoside hydrolase family 127 protein n=1 Tax=Cryobacterium algoricola TaxID=1259183 RepID=A0ABY2I863_9MICO|nr:beta-L-arabinofuranosidase domain-containing protein [Cryobacterium algoricola]TFB84015.1 glycoside hydrolase family 127 protein [Cryobacterium algoricola]